MDELENMKALWLELNKKVSALEVENRILARKITNEKYKSTKEKLISRYNGFIIMEIITLFFMISYFWLNPFLIDKYRIVTALYWIVFFLFEISIDIYLRRGVSKIDIYNSSVTEISKRAAKNWKLHKLAIIIGFPFGIGACILFALALNANKFVIFGMISGGLVGLLIGFLQLKKFWHSYRLLQTSDE